MTITHPPLRRIRLARLTVHRTAVLLGALTLSWLTPLPAAAEQAAGASPDIRLYTLDCGQAEFKDFAPASDTGEFDGKPAVLADPCFLIRHPAGWLLWDAGLSAQAPGAAKPGDPDEPARFAREGFRTRVGPPLEQQLAPLGLHVADVNFIAFSHLHFDHVGQANLFAHAQWLLNRNEIAWATNEPPPTNVMPELFSARKSARMQLIDGDHDVFGDGRVRILKAPGHTPGSSVLLLHLPKTGYVILSGDLYVSLEGRRESLVPGINVDRAATLASMARIERIAKRLRARVIVQHDPQEFARLPKVPGYLQ